MIESLGYKTEPATPSAGASPAVQPPKVFTVPTDAPSSFRDAVERARRARKPMLVDFWAPWCAPCMRLKRETLESASLAPLLAQAEIIAVNLDEMPSLGKAYEVSSIPYLLFVDSQGRIVDRLLGFEPPSVFEVRLRKVLP